MDDESDLVQGDYSTEGQMVGAAVTMHVFYTSCDNACLLYKL